MTIGIGDVIDGKYQIVRLLGEGGMGAVYEGENTRIHRRVAIKVLHPAVASSREAMARFEREAQAAGRIGSEHIVEVLDLGDLPGGERFMVMEFLEGESLADRLDKGALAPREIGPIAVELLEGLKAAHNAGIIHRDLKPDNVFLLGTRSGRRDFVKIVDFGISKFSSTDGEFSMTRTGAVMGTPYYMAPEQAKGGKSIDHRVDLYAVGVILYQAVTGGVPFDAETFNELLFKIVLETPMPLAERAPGLDPDFVAIVEKAMAREPDARYRHATEFQTDLQNWLGGEHGSTGRTISAGTPAFDKTWQPEDVERPSQAEVTETKTPPEDATAAAAGPAAAAAAVGPAAAPANPRTQGAWANTGAGESALPLNRKPGVLVAAGVVALLGIGGLLFALGGSKDDETAEESNAAQQAQEEDEARREAERKSALEALQQERKKAEDARRKAEEALRESEKNQADLEARRRAEQAAEEAAAREKAASEAAQAVQRVSAPVTAAPKPAPRPAPAASPPPAPKPAPAPKPSSGRSIRTEL